MWMENRLVCCWRVGVTVRGDVREVFVRLEEPQVWMGVAVTRIYKV